MEFNIKQMNYDDAKQISKWTYDGPYSIYNMAGSENCINELLNGFYFSVSDRDNNVVGFYCFGESAQVPIENQFGVYDGKDITDIGLGMKPSFCGQGLGFDFFNSALEYGRNRLSAKDFRLTVAAFNQRAIKLYQKIGFKKIDSFERISDDGTVEFWITVLPQGK